MNDQVHASWRGIDQLAALTHEQYLNLAEASGLARSGQLADVGAFRGFLAFFRDTYQQALDAVTDGLDDATGSARQLSATIGEVRDDLRATDGGVSALHTTIEARVTCQAYTPGAVHDPPSEPGTSGGGWPLPGALTPGAVPGPGAHDPYGLVAGTSALLDHTQDLVETSDHEAAADAFVEEHAR